MCCVSPWGSWRKKYTQLSVVYSSVVLESRFQSVDVNSVWTLVRNADSVEEGLRIQGHPWLQSSWSPNWYTWNSVSTDIRSEQRTQIKPSETVKETCWIGHSGCGPEPTLTFPLVMMPSRVREPLSVEKSHYTGAWFLRFGDDSDIEF